MVFFIATCSFRIHDSHRRGKYRASRTFAHGHSRAGGLPLHFGLVFVAALSRKRVPNRLYHSPGEGGANPGGIAPWLTRLMGSYGATEIVGIGAVTPLGDGVAASAAANRAGIAAFEEHPYMIDCAGEPMITARVSRLEDASLFERMIEMGISAAQEALAPVAARAAGITMPL